MRCFDDVQYDNNIIRKLITKKYPNYDFERHRFKFGDLLHFRHGLILALESSFSNCEFFVVKRGFGLKEFETVKIAYNELPYYKKGEFKSLEYKISSICDVGKFVETKEGVCLLTEYGRKYFTGLCLNLDSYYYKSKILID